MSATRLLVLGVVRMAGQAHGYQVRRELLTWGADTWANTKPGSIYHALKKADRDGLLTAEGPEAGEGGPERTVYRLTEDGETEFQLLLRRSLSEPGDPASLSAGLTMLPALRREDAITLLTVRVNALQASLGRLTGWDVTDVGKPEHVREHVLLWTAQLNAEIDWARGLVERLRAGGYRMAGEA
ncbi:transcriptional regulator, PadR family [Streptoalloteichus tenebrarius]|uniref:Transcriptional regulator, PadR family n=1 Tax=Streptoalloteichus tenebrarius (strain ATCC 17920 / DSM 40477 / JCM 4838 / CBS 697.72 / NBRC 16177 / NCIMB 11028 / NRRL B-12390 / A12253. 1 / ISP 5477) TaxID=1933 RepID=A0ABT1I421_STRSD|nr:PadR family transcriptional regulator [Streptoalloteichus tenebrarius]MCP2262530.1 transcriptional regulator, PadR family [Streptoalloteichus tenebrarius]BFF01237.1 PadR family transcriptional regulator [Streptoalloteichus tenebrarius]